MGRSQTNLSIHQIQPASLSNGPGWRAVIWLQGCTLACPGCFNPQTHAPMGGQLLAVDNLVKQIMALQPSIEGITISGGEPLQQLTGLLAFLAQIRATSSLSCVLFSGYSWSEIQKMPQANRLLSVIDVLIAGRYLENQRLAQGLIGSQNKTVHFLTSRYTPADLQAVPEAEVILTKNGEIIYTGINPARWAE